MRPVRCAVVRTSPDRSGSGAATRAAFPPPDPLFKGTRATVLPGNEGPGEAIGVLPRSVAVCPLLASRHLLPAPSGYSAARHPSPLPPSLPPYAFPPPPIPPHPTPSQRLPPTIRHTPSAHFPCLGPSNLPGATCSKPLPTIMTVTPACLFLPP
ncbi:hypothetical protein E2C01_034071 [Portunus trituberculatus]|uniref:Uncharacterized protein n=1 Tax=Portunus trituberculatus TaxID=210409 RepID=A0A5B7F0I0_PORTR|nr:hypothetical protein [Portunus trituberculatus]